MPPGSARPARWPSRTWTRRAAPPTAAGGRTDPTPTPPPPPPVPLPPGQGARPCSAEGYRPVDRGAVRPSVRAATNPQLEGGVAEPEVLPDPPLQVAQVGRRQRAGGEQRERRRFARSLGGVEHTTAGRGGLALRPLQELVELPGGHPLLVRVQGGAEGGEELVHPLPGPGAHRQHR